MQYANNHDLPFLAYTGAHGSITTLGQMNHGIEIDMKQLNSVAVAADGQTATIGGGTISKSVTDALWAAGKQTGKFATAQHTTQSRDANIGHSDGNL